MKRHLLWSLVVLVFAVAAVGCRPATQISTPNRRLLESLKTAVMSQNTEWLDKNEALIESRHGEGKLSADEYEALRAIVREARAGNWQAAQDEVMRLAKGQSSG